MGNAVQIDDTHKTFAEYDEATNAGLNGYIDNNNKLTDIRNKNAAVEFEVGRSINSTTCIYFTFLLAV